MNDTLHPLRAWLRRDRLFLLGLAVSVFVVQLSAAYADDFWRTWVLPLRHHDPLLLASWIVGTGLALTVALREPVLRLHEYALHRSAPACSRPRARILACCAILLLSPALVAGVQWGVEAAFGDAASLLNPHNATPFAAITATALSAFAVTLFAVQLRTARWKCAVLAAGLHVGVYAILDLATSTGRSTATPTAVLMAHWIAAAVFLGLAWQQHPTPHDPDRPIERVGPRLGLQSAAAVGTFAMLLGLAESRTELLRQYAHAGAVVAELKSGEIAMLHKKGWPTRFERIESGEVVTDVARDLSPYAAFSARSGFPSPGRFYHQERGPLWLRDGMVHAVSRKYDGFRLASARAVELGRDDRRTPFARGTRIVAWRRSQDEADNSLGLGFGDDEHWIVEPGADRLWRYAEDTMSLDSLALPAGATVEGSAGNFAVRVALGDGKTGVIEIGADGSLNRGEPAPPSLFERTATNGDPLTPAVSVAGQDGAAWTHDVEIGSAFRISLATLACALSAIQSPIATLTSSASVPATGRIFFWGWAPLQDPLVWGGHRIWLVCLGLAIAAFGAWGAHRYLARLGAARASRLSWTVFCALFGPVGLFWLVLLERPRAHRVVNPMAPPAPRILSRRSA